MVQSNIFIQRHRYWQEIAYECRNRKILKNNKYVPLLDAVGTLFQPQCRGSREPEFFKYQFFVDSGKYLQCCLTFQESRKIKRNPPHKPKTKSVCPLAPALSAIRNNVMRETTCTGHLIQLIEFSQKRIIWTVQCQNLKHQENTYPTCRTGLETRYFSRKALGAMSYMIEVARCAKMLSIVCLGCCLRITIVMIVMMIISAHLVILRYFWRGLARDGKMDWAAS